MPTNGALIDTSVWVEYLRGRRSGLVEQVRVLIDSGQAVLCGVVLAELLAGMRTKAAHEDLKDMLRGLPYVEVTRAVWERAGSMSADLRRKGTIIPLSDLVVGTIALEHGHQVLTGDTHFSRIPRLSLLAPVEG